MIEKHIINTDPVWGMLESADWLTKIFGFVVLIVILALLTGNGKSLFDVVIALGNSVKGVFVLVYSWVTKRGNPSGFLEVSRWPYDNISIVLEAPENISYEDEETQQFFDNHAFLFRSIRRMQFSGKKICIDLSRLQWVSTHGRKMLCDLIRYHAKKNVIKLTFLFPSRMSESVKILHDEIQTTAKETNAMSLFIKKQAVKKK